MSINQETYLSIQSVSLTRLKTREFRHFQCRRDFDDFLYKNKKIGGFHRFFITFSYFCYCGCSTHVVLKFIFNNKKLSDQENQTVLKKLKNSKKLKWLDSLPNLTWRKFESNLNNDLLLKIAWNNIAEQGQIKVRSDTWVDQVPQKNRRKTIKSRQQMSFFYFKITLHHLDVPRKKICLCCARDQTSSNFSQAYEISLFVIFLFPGMFEVRNLSNLFLWFLTKCWAKTLVNYCI